MSFDNLAPKLLLKKTISHPSDKTETGLVMGFTARESLLGLDALALKATELPVVRDAPAVTHFIIPREQAEQAIEEDLYVYILGDHRVYRIDPVEFEKAEVHVGTKHGEEIEGAKVSLTEMNEWPRQQCEVSN